jgi:hypothetical protein
LDKHVFYILEDDVVATLYIIKYSILLVRALDNWDEAKLYLRTAEHQWCYVWDLAQQQSFA